MYMLSFVAGVVASSQRRLYTCKEECNFERMQFWLTDCDKFRTSPNFKDLKFPMYTFKSATTFNQRNLGSNVHWPRNRVLPCSFPGHHNSSFLLGHRVEPVRSNRKCRNLDPCQQNEFQQTANPPTPVY